MGQEYEIEVRIMKVRPGAQEPLYATSGAAGGDLYAAIEESVTLAPGERALIPTGLAVALQSGYEVQIRPRSGLALKHGVTVVNTPGTIDSCYRGEIGVILINHGKEEFTVEPGDRIAQMVLAEVKRPQFKFVDELDETDRGAGAFGHTGQK